MQVGFSRDVVRACTSEIMFGRRPNAYNKLDTYDRLMVDLLIGNHERMDGFTGSFKTTAEDGVWSRFIATLMDRGQSKPTLTAAMKDRMEMPDTATDDDVLRRAEVLRKAKNQEHPFVRMAIGIAERLGLLPQPERVEPARPLDVAA